MEDKRLFKMSEFKNNPYEEKVDIITFILKKRLEMCQEKLFWLIAMDISVALDIKEYLETEKWTGELAEILDGVKLGKSGRLQGW